MVGKERVSLPVLVRVRSQDVCLSGSATFQGVKSDWNHSKIRVGDDYLYLFQEIELRGAGFCRLQIQMKPSGVSILNRLITSLDGDTE
jgi:hypothetical protein